MNSRQRDIDSTIEQLVENSVHKYLDDVLGNLAMDIKNENARSSIKQSGNGIVYIDNSGIAFAFLLFFRYFMKDQINEEDFQDLQSKIETLMEGNRNSFVQALNSLKES
ncbi:hypothetical protein [Ornithinibacillus xuwenensis]|jgi:hypothetical protein|uniref:Uncharacterized protein n=1 Tax=Ornithinibacillus xuwenensis TaxID=3144668 RepID=A0ABU9XGQ0_9BACI